MTRPAGSVTVLVTTARVAPGLLSAQAWRRVAEAALVVAPDLRDPTARALLGAGIDVRPLADGDPLAGAATGGPVVWVAPTGDPEWSRRWAEQLVGAGGDALDLEVVHASYDLPGARLLDLVEVMDRLRTGCPWDREQTHLSLAPYLLEEAYETLEAIDSGDPDHLREELGDLLLQVVFHARVAADGEPGWDVDDVAAGIVDKLVRRHPHVFADVEASDAAAVEANWETIKAEEKQRESVLDGIPAALPALARADKLLGRLQRAGLDPAPAGDGDAAAEARLGEELLALVRRARAAGLDAEQALRRRLQAVEAHARAEERAREHG